MATASFDTALEAFRQRTLRDLPAAWQDDFQRLSRTLVYGSPFQWLLIDAPHEGARKQVMKALAAVMRQAKLRTSTLPLSARVPGVPELEDRLVKNAGQSDVVHVIGRPGWFTPQRWHEFNVRRERLASKARAKMVFWLDAKAITLASEGAPDLWAWRGGVYEFEAEAAHVDDPINANAPGTGATANVEVKSASSAAPALPNKKAEVTARMQDLRKFINQQPPPPDDLLEAPLREMVTLLMGDEDWEATLVFLRLHVLPFYRRHDDVSGGLNAQAMEAFALTMHGELDTAMALLRNELLLKAKDAGDSRALVLIWQNIARISQQKGQLDEALRICTEEVLPPLLGFGNAHAIALQRAYAADLIAQLGGVDEALQILRTDVLPVFEQANESAHIAATYSDIAALLQKRGELDEALHLLRDKVLPLYERIEDAKGRAAAQDHIAQIVALRNQSR